MTKENKIKKAGFLTRLFFGKKSAEETENDSENIRLSQNISNVQKALPMRDPNEPPRKVREKKRLSTLVKQSSLGGVEERMSFSSDEGIPEEDEGPTEREPTAFDTQKEQHSNAFVNAYVQSRQLSRSVGSHAESIATQQNRSRARSSVTDASGGNRRISNRSPVPPDSSSAASTSKPFAGITDVAAARAKLRHQQTMEQDTAPKQGGRLGDGIVMPPTGLRHVSLKPPVAPPPPSAPQVALRSTGARDKLLGPTPGIAAMSPHSSRAPSPAAGPIDDSDTASVASGGSRTLRRMSRVLQSRKYSAARESGSFTSPAPSPPNTPRQASPAPQPPPPAAAPPIDWSITPKSEAHKTTISRLFSFVESEKETPEEASAGADAVVELNSGTFAAELYDLIASSRAKPPPPPPEAPPASDERQGEGIPSDTGKSTTAKRSSVADILPGVSDDVYIALILLVGSHHSNRRREQAFRGRGEERGCEAKRPSMSDISGELG